MGIKPSFLIGGILIFFILSFAISQIQWIYRLYQFKFRF